MTNLTLEIVFWAILISYLGLTDQIIKSKSLPLSIFYDVFI